MDIGDERKRERKNKGKKEGKSLEGEEERKKEGMFACLFVCLFVLVLWYINLCRLCNAKSILIQINGSISNNSV